MTGPATPDDDHTLVVTTFNRPHMLQKLLRFIAGDRPVGRILILDGSNAFNHRRNSQIIARITGEFTVTHRRTPTHLTVLEMYRSAVLAVETEFMTLVHDDNLVVLDCVCESLSFLRQNPDFVVCAGRIAYVGIVGRTVEISATDALSIVSDDPLQRVTQFIAQYWSIDFGTWRTEVRKKILPGLALYDLDEAIGEPFHNALAAVEGKFHVLDRIGPIFLMHDDNHIARTITNRLAIANPLFGDTVDAAADLLRKTSDALGSKSGALREMLVCAIVDHIAAYSKLFADGMVRTILGIAAPDADAEAVSALLLKMRLDVRRFLFQTDDAGKLAEPRLNELMAHPGASGHRLVMEYHRDMAIMHRTVTVLAEHTGASHPAKQACIAAMSAPEWPDRATRFLAGVAAQYLPANETPGAGEAKMRKPAPQPGDTEIRMRALLLGAIALELRPAASLEQFRALDLDPDSERGAQHRLILVKAARAIGDRANPWPGECYPQELITEEPVQFLDAEPYDAIAAVPGILNVNEAQISNNTTLIPLHWERATGGVEAGASFWLRVNAHVTAGRLQIGIFADGDFHSLKTLEPKPDVQTLFLPLARCRSELVIIRSLSGSRQEMIGSIEHIDVVTVAIHARMGNIPSTPHERQCNAA